MLNPIVDVDVTEIERVRPIIPPKNFGNVVRNEETERRGEVVQPHGSVHLPESNVATIMW